MVRDAAIALSQRYNPHTILVEDFIYELTTFPVSKFDDQVDAMSQALCYMRERLDEPGLITFYRMEVERMRREGRIP